MKKLRSYTRRVLTNKKGQGMTEYILLLVVVVGIVMMFKGKIVKIISDKTGELGNNINAVTPDAN